MSPKRRRRGGPPRSRNRPSRQGVAERAEVVLLGDGAEEALRGALRRAGWTVDGVERKSVQRRGRDLSIVFRTKLRRDGAERTSTVVVHHSANRVPDGTTTFVVGGLRVHVWRYPSDPYLPGLHRATSRRKVLELLAELGSPRPDVAIDQVELTRRVYRPTRRAVVQVDLDTPGGSERVFVKVLGDRDPAKMAARTGELARHHRVLAARLPVPALVGVREDQGILAIENVPGRTLRQSILDGDPAPTPSEVAGLAITLAGIEVESTSNPVRYADPTRHAKVIGGVLPDEARRVQRLVQECEVRGPLVTVHGDFHDGQVLIHEGRISGLIDVDGVGAGHLAHDAGRMIAYVESIGDIDRADGPTVQAWSQGLQDAFSDHVDEETLGRATAAAWIALATGPHRRQQLEWEAATRRRLDHAQRWLETIGAL